MEATDSDKPTVPSALSLPPRDSWLSNINISESPDKGRVVIATRDFLAGDVILQEDPILSASWYNFRCLCCNQPHKPADCDEARKIFPPKVFQNLDALQEAIAEVSRLEELDKARMFLILTNSLFLAHLAQNRLDDAIVESFPAIKAQYSKVFDLISNRENFSRGKLDESMVAVGEAFRLFGEAEAEYCDDKFGFETVENKKILADLISLINNNCHTLESFSGSGVFELSSKFEHSCLPNCNFSSFFYSEENKNVLTICALKPIKAGDHLALDYIESFYQPTSERTQILAESYGFQCSCDLCSGKVDDIVRSFVCPNSPEDSDDDEEGDEDNGAPKRKKDIAERLKSKHRISPPSWTCSLCNYKCSAEEIEKYEDFESELAAENPESVEEILGVLEQAMVRKEHYLIFESLDSLSHDMVQEEMPQEEFQQSGIDMLFQMLVECVEIVCGTENYYCYDKVRYFDELAQIYVQFGEIEEAQYWFTRAYEMSLKTCGPAELVPATHELKDLSLNPPDSVSKLMSRYHNVQAVEDQLRYEGDVQGLEDFKNLTVSGFGFTGEEYEDDDDNDHPEIEELGDDEEAEQGEDYDDDYADEDEDENLPDGR